MTDSKKNKVEGCPLAFTVLGLQWLKGPHSCVGIIDWGEQGSDRKIKPP